MVKKLFLALLLVLLVPRTILAENFVVSGETTYEVPQTGDTKVVHNITITNVTTEVHATDYTLSLGGAQVDKVRAFDDSGEFKTEITRGELTRIKVLFDRPVVGAGSSRSFTIEYFDTSIVVNSGDVTEISVPKLSGDLFDSYLVRLSVPKTFGEHAYISPEPENILETGTGKTYYFNEASVSMAGISAAFGQFQVFSFDLTYHLQNPLALPTKMEIALPPDTSFQKIYFDSINPKPDSIYEDSDGNWLGVYKLAARERLDVRAIGNAQIFASPWKSASHTPSAANLASTEFWQSDAPELKSVSAELHTPKEIYDYVVAHLSYNYSKVSTGSTRLGALGALKNPKDSICTEFTDLFIALARAAGIPAREVNGYAYTDNSALKPLALVADVLHAWPEYWDSDKQIWVPVDPTWGDTTGGVDYFSKLDMRHMSFVMHGESSTPPPGSYKLGASPQKDVFVSIGKLPEKGAGPTITITQRTSLPFQGVTLVADIKNPGQTALYSQKVVLAFGDEQKYEAEIPLLLPYEKRTLEFTVPYGFFGNSMPQEALITVGSSSASFTTDKKPAIIRDGIALGVIVLLIILAVFVLIRKLKR